MAWTDSRIFRAYVTDSLNRTAAFDLNADAFKVALYNNTTTPDRDAAAASTGYNTGQWVVANEVTEAGPWPAGGVALASVTVTNPAAGVTMFDAADTASGAGADLANVFGCLVYDDTLTTPVADQGVCFNYFGGAQSVVNGTFTIQWAANGIFRITT